MKETAGGSDTEQIPARSTPEAASAGWIGPDAVDIIDHSGDMGSATDGDRPDAMDWEVPRPKGSWFYLCTQWVHRLQATRAQRASRGHDPWKRGLRIMAYHRVSTDRDELAVTPTAFRAQMEALLRAGAQPVRLDEALDLLEERPASRYVCVTFDDGYHDNLDHAIPVLRDLQIPATIFIPSGFIDGNARPYWYEHPPPMLSWSELREIAQDDLFAIGAHTRTHPALPKLSDDGAWIEIAASKRDVEEHTDQRATAFAYPAGLYGEREIRMVREAGYRVGVTVEPGLIGPGHRPQTLPRSFIDRRDNLHMFEAKLTGLLDAPWGLRDAVRLPGRLRQQARRTADDRHTSAGAREDPPITSSG
jgi:peptidoglycan/xylan/chitin deacetylase (PgdA/CDA1 family)